MVTLNIERVKEFYSTFANTMGQVALQHGCEIILPSVDGLKFSFPLKSNLTDDNAIRNVLECFFEQLERRHSLSLDMGGQELREISCRICADYGTCSVMEPGDEIECGPSIPSIDRMRWRVPAQANTIIVGDEFYKVIETFPLLDKRYFFERKEDCVMNNVPYPIYQLYRKT